MPRAGLADSVVAMRPFVPTRDFRQSLTFYEAVGFVATPLGDQLARLALSGRRGDLAFLLQDFYVRELAENLMLQLLVDDLDAWWEHISACRLEERFGVVPPKAPKLEP